MRTAEEYADGAEKALDKAGECQIENPSLAALHMTAAVVLSNLAIASSSSSEHSRPKAKTAVRAPGGYL